MITRRGKKGAGAERRGESRGGSRTVSAQFSAPRILQVGGGVWVSTHIEGGHRETGRIVSVSPQFSAPVVGESDRPARLMIDGVERDRKETQRWLRCRTIRKGAFL